MIMIITMTPEWKQDPVVQQHEYLLQRELSEDRRRTRTGTGIVGEESGRCRTLSWFSISPSQCRSCFPSDPWQFPSPTRRSLSHRWRRSPRLFAHDGLLHSRKWYSMCPTFQKHSRSYNQFKCQATWWKGCIDLQSPNWDISAIFLAVFCPRSKRFDCNSQVLRRWIWTFKTVMLDWHLLLESKWYRGPRIGQIASPEVNLAWSFWKWWLQQR